MTNIVRLVSAMALTGLLGGVPSALAQQPSLADVARQEAERRKSTDKAKKLYTNDDIKAGRPLTTAGAASAPTPAAGTEGADKAASTADQPAGKTSSNKLDEVVLKRILDLKEQVSRHQLELERLQTRIDEVNTAVVNAFDQMEREGLDSRPGRRPARVPPPAVRDGRQGQDDRRPRGRGPEDATTDAVSV